MTDTRSGPVIERDERDKIWDKAADECETSVFSDQLDLYSVRLLATFAERVAERVRQTDLDDDEQNLVVRIVREAAGGKHD